MTVDTGSTAIADPFSSNAGATEVTGGEAIARELLRIADTRDEVVLVSPDVGLSPLSAAFVDRHPNRYFDVGIAENNAISVAAGLAASGLIPYVVGMSAFTALKCAEQIRTDLAYTRMRVRLIAAWGGMDMGYFGTSHLALEDLAVTRAIPGLAVASVADDAAASAVLGSTVDLDGPLYLRIGPTGHAPVYPADFSVPAQGWTEFGQGSDITILAHGLGTGIAVTAAKELAAAGIGVTVIDVIYLAPFDEKIVERALSRNERILVVEEHLSIGGLGSLVSEVLTRRRLRAAFAAISLPATDLATALPHHLRERYNLTPAGVVNKVKELIAER